MGCLCLSARGWEGGTCLLQKHSGGKQDLDDRDESVEVLCSPGMDQGGNLGLEPLFCSSDCIHPGHLSTHPSHLSHLAHLPH